MSGLAPACDPVTAALIDADHAPADLTAHLTRPALGGLGVRWKVALAASSLIALMGGSSAAWLLYKGVGVWGVRAPVGWGLAIVNFVWWIGIGHAGTLISAILLLLRQSWRNSINRFAEVMTLFAVLNAAMFPLLHLGRYWKFYYLLPYPNQMRVWPQWRSPLVWDAFAVTTYALVSLMFWYLGLIPDLATLRDRAGSRLARRAAGLFALGWRGAGFQWHALRRAYLLLAGLATALVVSVHSIVSLDFAAGIVPGWNAAVFPPYFVAGAIYSGMAMVLTIAVPLRALLDLRGLVTARHLDLMAKVMLCSGLIVAYGYLVEVWDEWHSGSAAEHHRLASRLVGHGAWSFWSTIFCNVGVAQLLWFRRVRSSALVLLAVSILINLGMWLERYDIIVTGLEEDYLSSSWRSYTPTIHDWLLLAGTLGLFVTLFLLFVRLLPVSPIYEVKELAHTSGRLEPSATAGRAAPGAHPGGLLAFGSPDRLAGAVRRALASGAARLETFTPMPLQELEDALAPRRDRIGPAVLIGGIAGGASGFVMQLIAARWDYPWLVDGKPPNSWPSFIPITFELTILVAAVSGFVAGLRAAGLPRLHHPHFDLPGFEHATSDGYLLWIDPQDPRYLPAAKAAAEEAA